MQVVPGYTFSQGRIERSSKLTAAFHRGLPDLLVSALIFRPTALDELQDGVDVAIGKGRSEGWHVALVATSDNGGSALFGEAEQQLVRMVPCMAGGVLGRGAIGGIDPPGRAPAFPIWKRRRPPEGTGRL